ncbi:MAG TPA: hypothetical protein VFA45_21885 [Actinomycetes bacterium]|jgi:uncharacterized protein YbjT (DUF2867 family)|nr:hypothetical protein [Actinomycetes bacterium]
MEPGAGASSGPASPWPSPEAIDRDANLALVQAAAAAGVQHLALVSVLGAAPDHPMSLHRAKDAAEQTLRAMSVLARPFSPGFARQAQAAVVMSGTDMAVDVSAIRDRLAAIPATTLDQVIRRRPTLEAPGAAGGAPSSGGTPGR